MHSLTDNEQQLAQATDPAVRLVLLQDRVVLLARVERLADAEAALLEADKLLSGAGPCAQLRSRYARAVLDYFSRQFKKATNALLEVLDEARDHCPRELVGEIQSALALFTQRDGDVRASAYHARAVLANKVATGESRYRALLALASLHQDAYDYGKAVALYREAEEIARDRQDVVGRGSCLLRMAATRASQARQAAATGRPDPENVARVADEIVESIAFARSNLALQERNLEALLLAEMRMLQGQYGVALELYDIHLPDAEGSGHLPEVTAALSDRAFCLLQLGRADAALSGAQSALARLDDWTPADIRAIVQDNMAAVLASRGDRELAEQHRVLARMAWQAHAHAQREALRVLQGSAPPTLME
jgi:tetratricopeptide (TPR) repeat protein